MKHYLTLVCVCMLALGCGGSTSTIDWGTIDASADADANYTTNTCYSDQNVWVNSPSPWLLPKPEVHIVFWGSWWETSKSSQLDNMIIAWNTMANDPIFYQGLSEYGIEAGTLSGTYSANWNIPSGPLSEKYIQTELQAEIGSDLPASNSNSLFVIELPPGIRSQYDIDSKFSGHHNNVSGIAYAVVDYDTSDGMNITTSHEIYEACTDVNGSGFHGAGGETEIGDYCEGHNYILDSYTIQMLWSQAQCQCIQ